MHCFYFSPLIIESASHELAMESALE